jgi:hypothetical protein
MSSIENLIIDTFDSYVDCQAEPFGFIWGSDVNSGVHNRVGSHFGSAKFSCLVLDGTKEAAYTEDDVQGSSGEIIHETLTYQRNPWQTAFQGFLRPRFLQVLSEGRGESLSPQI